jgi:hypothetical protein
VAQTLQNIYQAIPVLFDTVMAYMYIDMSVSLHWENATSYFETPKNLISRNMFNIHDYVELSCGRHSFRKIKLNLQEKCLCS